MPAHAGSLPFIFGGSMLDEYVDVKATVRELCASGEYWVIQALAPEWERVLIRFAKDRFPDGAGEDRKCGMVLPFNGAPIFFFRRDQVPAADIQTALGVDRDTLLVAEVLQMLPVARDWPKPTVYYEGEA